MQNIFHTKYAFTFFIASFLTDSTAFSMETLPHEFQRTYFECKDDCERKGTHHNSPLYGPVLLREYKKCEKQCERESKSHSLFLKMEQRGINAGRLFEQLKNQ